MNNRLFNSAMKKLGGTNLEAEEQKRWKKEAVFMVRVELPKRLKRRFELLSHNRNRKKIIE